MHDILKSADVKRFVVVSTLLFWCFSMFLRWNSWDVLVAPTRVFEILSAMTQPWAHARPLAVTAVFGVVFALGYIRVRILLVQPESS